MESLGDFLGVSLVIQFQEAGKDFTTSGFTDREPSALLGFVEAVTEFEVGPAVGSGDGIVHFDVKITE